MIIRKIYLSIIAIGFIIISCGKTDKKESEVVTTKTKNLDPGIEQVIISKEEFVKDELRFTQLVDLKAGAKVSSTGIIDVPPNGRSVISAQIGGYIKKSTLLIGDRVRKGQLLVVIENIEFIELQQKYMEAKEQLSFLESNYQRQKELFEEKITSEKSFLKAQSDYKRTLAIYRSLKKKLDLLNIDIHEVEKGNLSSVSRIYAPIAGNITQLNVITGSYVSSADVIMEIVNTEHLHLELRIFEKDMLKVKIGQPVVFTLPESGAQKYKGKVHLIGKSIGTDRTVTLHVHIDDSVRTSFIPGMFVQAEIMTNDHEGIAIAKQAIVNRNGKAFLLRHASEDNDQYAFEEIEVKTGLTLGDLVIIESQEHLDFNENFLFGFKNNL